ETSASLMGPPAAITRSRSALLSAQFRSAVPWSGQSRGTSPRPTTRGRHRVALLPTTTVPKALIKAAPLPKYTRSVNSPTAGPALHGHSPHRHPASGGPPTGREDRR